MTQYLIDTGWLIDVLHGMRQEEDVLLDFIQFGVAVSIITYGELYEGAYYARNREQALHTLQEFLTGFMLLPLTVAVVERFAVLRGSLSRPIRQQVGDMDLLIAATALTHDLTLVTHNLNDFRHVPGLRLYPGESAP